MLKNDHHSRQILVVPLVSIIVFLVGYNSVFASTEDLIAYSAAGDVPNVQRLIKEGTNVNDADDNGTTPLYMASQEGHHETVKLLLDADADVNAADSNGFTPLLVASLQGHHETVKLLLDAKANVNVVQ